MKVNSSFWSINIQNFQTQELEISDSVKRKMESKAPIFDSEAESRKQKLFDFEEKKKNEEEIQARAFNLVDIGKRFDRESKYEKAVEKFNQAIDLLKSIEWDAYIQPIINLINDIKEKQKEALWHRQRKKLICSRNTKRSTRQRPNRRLSRLVRRSI